MSFSGLGVGTYQTFYTFEVTGSYCNSLVSNTGSIVVNVEDPDCEFEISIAGYQTLILLSPSISGSEVIVELEEI